LLGARSEELYTGSVAAVYPRKSCIPSDLAPSQVRRAAYHSVVYIPQISKSCIPLFGPGYGGTSPGRWCICMGGIYITRWYIYRRYLRAVYRSSDLARSQVRRYTAAAEPALRGPVPVRSRTGGRGARGWAIAGAAARPRAGLADPARAAPPEPATTYTHSNRAPPRPVDPGETAVS
jgi:hypothetical protein